MKKEVKEKEIKRSERGNEEMKRRRRRKEELNLPARGVQFGDGRAERWCGRAKCHSVMVHRIGQRKDLCVALVGVKGFWGKLMVMVMVMVMVCAGWLLLWAENGTRNFSSRVTVNCEREREGEREGRKGVGRVTQQWGPRLFLL